MKKSVPLSLWIFLFAAVIVGWATVDHGRAQAQSVTVGQAAGSKASQPDTPAMWKIDGPKGDIYLFGSIHLLPQGVNWRTPELDAALQAAEVVVFELDFDDGQNPATMMQLIRKFGILPEGDSLRELLTREQREQYERVAASVDVLVSRLDPMRPWIVALTLSVQWIASQGYDPKSGVDQQIWNWSKQNGKELAALETAEEQFQVFANLSREQELEYLVATLEQIEQMPTMLDDLVQTWHTGDTAQLDTLLNALLADVPELGLRLLKNRNAKWVPEIERMLADGRTHVVVGGAAHFVGQDSVIAMLRAKGVQVEGP